MAPREMSDCQRKARHPEEGGEWRSPLKSGEGVTEEWRRSPLKRDRPEDGEWAAVVGAGVQLRYTEGG